MAMTLGSVVVDGNGVVTTKTGVAGRYYDAIIGSLTVSIPSGSSGAPFLQQIAARANAEAKAMYDSITQDARTRVSPESTGLQRMPASTAENTDCKGPGSSKFLPIV